MKIGQQFGVACLAALLALAGCGGDDDVAGGQVLGPNGGTVSGPQGAAIVVPAGALAQTLELRIEPIDAASVALPAAVERVGAVHALTPHGTAFAAPVTVNLPFDASLVDAGRNVQMLKTTDAARTVWTAVAGATVSGNRISGAVDAFSYVVAVLVPLPPGPAPTVRAMPRRIAVGTGFAAAVRADGSVWTWGRNDDRQLGPGSTRGSDRLQPAQVTGIGNAVAVFALSDGFAVLRADGRVLGWGYTFLRTQFTQPVVDGAGLLDLAQVVQVAGGNGHTLALLADGSVWAWGANLFGQLGDGTRDEPTEPVRVGGLGSVVTIAAPGNASMAVLVDRSTWAWGSKQADVCLGPPGFDVLTAPQRVLTSSSFGALVHGQHALLWQPVGELSACGPHDVPPIYVASDTPRRVNVSAVATAVSGRFYDSAAAQIHPYLFAVDGQGVLQGYSGPGAAASAVSASGVVELAGGQGTVLFAKSDGSVWSWGENDHGQLGDGTRERRTVPVRVVGLTLN